MLDSEMVWLEALCRDTDLALPIPQRGRQGCYTTQADGVPCTLLTWVPGEQKQYFFYVKGTSFLFSGTPFWE
jgi:hypothetical protein